MRAAPGRRIRASTRDCPIAEPLIRVLIADDQDLVREGLRMILEAEPDIEVVGEAADGKRGARAERGVSIPTSC